MHADALADAPRPLLVGRERELGILRERLAAARAGNGSLVLVGGEAGIGKTALSEAICREATEGGALVLVGRCYDLTETPPYGPWVELLAHVPPRDDLPPLSPAFVAGGTPAAAVSQAALFRQIADFFAALAAQRPTVLLLDDLHWADPASLDLLRVLARTLAPLPLLILATYRAEDVPHDHPLSALLPLLVRESGAVRLDLRRLVADDVHALTLARYDLPAADVSRLVSYLHERAGGNPFFTLELVRTLEEEAVLTGGADGQWTLGDVSAVPVPVLLRRVIEGRVARLDGENRRLLAVAAVVGYECPFAVWGAVAGVDEDALLACVAEAEAAHLMTEAGDGAGATFTHALIRDTLYAGARPSERRRWHRGAGEALAAMPAPSADAVASHFQRAGDARAVEWLERAATHALGSFALLTAADRYAAALAHLGNEAKATSRRGWLLFRLGFVRRFDDLPGSLALVEEAAAVAVAADDRVLSLIAEFYLAHRYCWMDIGRGLAKVTAVVAKLDALPRAERDALRLPAPTDLSLDPIGGWSMLLKWSARAGRYADVRVLAARIAAHLASTDMAKGYVDVESGDYGLAVMHAMLGQPEEARTCFARSIAANRASGHRANLASELGELLAWVVIPYAADNPTERWRLVDESEAAAASARGLLTAEPSPGRVYIVAAWFVDGRWADARRLAGEIRAWEVASGVTLWRDAYPAIIGEIARLQGAAESAWAIVRDVFPSGAAHDPGDLHFRMGLALQRLAAALSLDAGEQASAKAWLDAHNRWMAWNGAVIGRAESQLAWAAYHRVLGDAARARHHAERALAEAAAPRQPLALLAAHRTLGELDTDAGRHEDAREHLRVSLALADACAVPYERALTLLAMAESYAATGEREAAHALVNEARALCEPLGAKPALARADALAARLDAAILPSPLYPAGLSAREVEVLRLLAGGRTNPEIADALFLSVATIRNHVAHILAKTDTTNRAAAAAFAERHGLT